MLYKWPNLIESVGLVTKKPWSTSESCTDGAHVGCYATSSWRWSCCLHFKSQVVPKKCWFKMRGPSGGWTLNQIAVNQGLRTRPGSWRTDHVFLLDGPVQEELRGNWSDFWLLACGLKQLILSDRRKAHGRKEKSLEEDGLNELIRVVWMERFKRSLKNPSLENKGWFYGLNWQIGFFFFFTSCMLSYIINK